MFKSLLKLFQHCRQYFDTVAEAWAVDLATGQAWMGGINSLLMDI